MLITVERSQDCSKRKSEDHTLARLIYSGVPFPLLLTTIFTNNILNINGEIRKEEKMITDKTCNEFVEVLATNAPVPGGGGASALVGGIGTALGNMVGSLTVGKKKYADVEDDIKALMKKADKLQKELLACVEKDAEVFEPLAKAYGMPKDTEEEKAAKAEVMAKVLKDACAVPLEIMHKCCDAIDICEEFAEKGSRLAISDAGVGVIFCKSALQGASLNVFINTKAMADKEYAAKINDEADEMLKECTVKADEVFGKVYSGLRA